MLFKLSLRNMRRSLKDYLIYFFTLVLGVAVFYVFNSLESQSVMLNVSENAHELIVLMTGVMSVLSVFVAVVLGFLIIYASRFLMKRRKREFGIYMTLGMGKGQISKILLIETLLIGLLSLAVGLALGIALSQLMSVFVANLFEADMTNFRFIFSSSALLTTIGLFSLIYLVVMIFNTLSVSKQKLISLIHSDKTNEKIKVRNLTLSLLALASSILLLANAYATVTGDLSDLDNTSLIICIVMGIAGTFLLFWSLSGLLLRFFMRLKGFYYKNLNAFILRELNSKINTTVISMSVISILLFLTICIFSSAMSIRGAMTKSLRDLAPADLQVVKYRNLSGEVSEEAFRKSKLSVIETMTELDIDIKNYFSDYAYLEAYRVKDVTYRQTIGAEALKESGVKPEDLENALDSYEVIAKLSEYNALARLYNNDELALDPNEYAVVANYDTAVSIRNKALKELSPTIKLDGRVLSPSKTTVIDGFLEMSSTPINSGVLVVPDDINLSGNESRSFFVGNYNIDGDEAKRELEDIITEKLFRDDVSQNNGYWIFTTTKTSIYEDSIGLRAMSTFIGLYLGVVFLITSAALLALKEISESSDNQAKYKTLRDLGVDQKAMNRTLLIQITLFFGLPLLVACIHSFFGIIFANTIIKSFAHADLLSSILATALFILAIYGGYFLITYQTSKRIIMSRD